MLDTLERPDTRTEIVLDWDAEPKCQSAHYKSTEPCTVVARYVAVSECQHVSALWCEARYREHKLTAPWRVHKGCGQPLKTCWKVRAL